MAPRRRCPTSPAKRVDKVFRGFPSLLNKGPQLDSKYHQARTRRFELRVVGRSRKWEDFRTERCRPRRQGTAQVSFAMSHECSAVLLPAPARRSSGHPQCCRAEARTVGVLSAADCTSCRDLFRILVRKISGKLEGRHGPYIRNLNKESN